MELHVFHTHKLRTSRDEADIIGSGSFGVVRRVHNEQIGTGAMKIFRITGTPENQALVITRAKDEAKLLMYINHENVVRCHGVAIWSNYFAVVMDCMEGGTMYDFLSDNSVPQIPFKLRFRMMHELSKALVYLHHSASDQRVVHGDLKTKNIFLTYDLHVRLGDFGAAILATMTSDRSTQVARSTNSTHTILYAAPEFLTSIYGERRRAMDVYSLGMVLYEMITQKPPFFDMELNAGTERAQRITEKIIRGERPSSNLIGAVLDNLRQSADETYRHVSSLEPKIKECWAQEPSLRPTTESMEKFFADICGEFRIADVIKEAAVVVNLQHHGVPQATPQDLVTIDQINF